MKNSIRFVATLVRYLVPLLLLGWLFHKLWSDDRQSIMTLSERLDNWPQLLLAVGVYLLALLGTFYRWYLLVVALRLPFRYADAVRLGFIGFLLQFVSLGSVGGDLFKAIFIAKEQPERRPEAVATVFVDRLLGLFGLTMMACFTFALVDTSQLGQLSSIRVACLALTIAGILAFLILFWTDFSFERLLHRFRKIEFVRTIVRRLQAALNLYRKHRQTLLKAVMLSTMTHFGHALAIYLAAKAVFEKGPTILQQMGLWSIAGTVSAIPIAPAGLGTFDFTYSKFYEVFASNPVTNEGFLVALLYRVMCLVAATIGVGYFWLARKEINRDGMDARQST